MGTVSDSLERVRYYLKDTVRRKYTDAQLLRLYNQRRRKMFTSLPIRVRGAVLNNPPIIRFGVTEKWEVDHVGDDLHWEPLDFNSVGEYKATQEWETQTFVYSYDTPGGYTITSTQEIMYVTPRQSVPHPFPTDFFRPLHFAWKGQAVRQVDMREIQKDEYWRNKQSDEVLLYATEAWMGRQRFIPYPQPTSASVTLDADSLTEYGLPIYTEAEEVDWYQAGDASIVYGMDSLDPENITSGVVTEIGEVNSSWSVIFQVVPSDIEIGDISSEDRFLVRPWRKYLEFGVAAEGFKTAKEFKNPQLAKFLEFRYTQGLEIIRYALGKLRSDRIVRRKGIDETEADKIGLAHPRLPAGYPAIEW